MTVMCARVMVLVLVPIVLEVLPKQGGGPMHVGTKKAEAETQMAEKASHQTTHSASEGP